MDLHYKQEITVGVLVLLGVGLFLAGTMWLRGQSFGGAGATVDIMFPDVGTLKRGSPVRVSGVELGSIEDIEYQGVGRVLVTAMLQPVVEPRIDATAQLTSVGLVGDAAVSFHPGRASEPLPAGRVIQGTVAPGLTDIGSDLGAAAKQTLSGVQEIANRDMAEELKETLNALQRTLALFQNTRQGPTAEVTETMRALQRTTARLDTLITRTDLPGTLRQADTLITTLTGTTAEFQTTAARFDTLLQRLNGGEGTLGKLVTDTLLYGDLRRLARSAQELVDEIRKHPGKITIQVRVF